MLYAHFTTSEGDFTAKLFDDQAPYDSQAWLFPYRVIPSEVAEFMP